MSFKRRILLPILLICFLCGCSQNSTLTNTSFQNFTSSLFQSEVSSSTINLQYSLKNPEQYGITTQPITLGTFSHDELSDFSYLENITAALENFSYDNLSDENQLTYDVLSYYLSLCKQGVSYALYEEPLSPTTGVHVQLPILLTEFPFYDKEDVEIYLKLLETFPDYFKSLIDFEKEKSKNGLFMSEVIADEVIKQCNSFVEMGEDNYLIATFEERLKEVNGISEDVAAKFIRQNKTIITSAVLSSYRNLISAISVMKHSNTNTHGLCRLPKGQDYYAHLVLSSTGSSRSIKDIKTLIQDQIKSDMSDLHTALQNSSDTLSEVSSITMKPDEILDVLKTDICTAFPDPANVNVIVKNVPAALEDHLSPAFYLVPPIDNYEDNIIYINNGYLTDDISLFTTLAHEGYPGHLYQTTYYASTNPDPIRTWLNFTGYVEGWATYTEMCSYYINPLEKSTATVLQKNNSIILGLYAMADIGIHYDGWDVNDTLDFFSSYGIDDKNVIKEIYEIILGDPANYLSYYVGYVEILELKKGFEGSQMEFHRKLLEIGPAPFKVITNYL